MLVQHVLTSLFFPQQLLCLQQIPVKPQPASCAINQPLLEQELG